MWAMAVRGTITKTNSGPRPYSAYRQDGSFIDTFVSVRKAQEPIESAAGGRKLRWTEQIRVTGTRTLIGEDP